jgi:hypothetical protein
LFLIDAALFCSTEHPIVRFWLSPIYVSWYATASAIPSWIKLNTEKNTLSLGAVT